MRSELVLAVATAVSATAARVGAATPTAGRRPRVVVVCEKKRGKSRRRGGHAGDGGGSGSGDKHICNGLRDRGRGHDCGCRDVGDDHGDVVVRRCAAKALLAHRDAELQQGCSGGRGVAEQVRAAHDVAYLVVVHGVPQAVRCHDHGARDAGGGRGYGGDVRSGNEAVAVQVEVAERARHCQHIVAAAHVGGPAVADIRILEAASGVHHVVACSGQEDVAGLRVAAKDEHSGARARGADALELAERRGGVVAHAQRHARRVVGVKVHRLGVADVRGGHCAGRGVNAHCRGSRAAAVRHRGRGIIGESRRLVICTLSLRERHAARCQMRAQVVAERDVGIGKQRLERDGGRRGGKGIGNGNRRLLAVGAVTVKHRQQVCACNGAVLLVACTATVTGGSCVGNDGGHLGRNRWKGKEGRKAGRLESFRGGLTAIGIAAPHQPAKK